MNLRRVLLLAPFPTLAIGLTLGAACRQNPLVERANPAPTAVAKINPAAPSEAPVMVTLDGTGSTDDGSITEYRWLSATPKPDGMPGRYIPPGESADWPADTAMTTVQLPEGIWSFQLWVKDDQGVVGAPAKVTVNVGDVPVPAAGAGGSNAAAGSGGAAAGSDG
jgi:hypothetical protein